MQDPKKILWNNIASIHTCMLVTQTFSGLRSRPMAPIHDEDANVIRFIAKAEDYKDDEIKANPQVCLAYADVSSNTYVSISGEARVITDREHIRRHWSDAADPWFEEGSDDPNAILIEVEPDKGEYWDISSSDVLVALKIATAAAKGAEPEFGHRAKVNL